MSGHIHRVADISPSFYLGLSPTGGYPFDEVNTCPMFIAPNFATFKWRNISKHQLSIKIEDFNRGCSKAFFNEYMIYIHVPFCRSFCHYCNFARNKFTWKDSQTMDTYTDYLLREFDAYLEKFSYFEDKILTAVYIGGGSPSTLGVKNIEKLLSHLDRRLPAYRQVEKTFTGEPKTLYDYNLLKALIDNGIDRVTFGIETTDPTLKKYIGRTDTAEQVEQVFENLQKLNYQGDTAVDFMFNHPGQTFDDMAADLDQVVNRYSPIEIDTYNTIYVPYRPLHKLVLRGAVPQPANILELLKMKEFLYDYLLTHGYHNTIAETYSKHEHKSQYQTAHCGRQNIVGIGIGARGMFDTNIAINPPDMKDWMRNVDEHGGISMDSFQDVKMEGLLHRIMVMWPRYKQLEKSFLHRFSETTNYSKMSKLLKKHLQKKIAHETEDMYIINKLGVLWHPNMQWEYMHFDLNIWGKAVRKHFSEKKKRWTAKTRYRRTMVTRFIDYFTEKFPRYMK